MDLRNKSRRCMTISCTNLAKKRSKTGRCRQCQYREAKRTQRKIEKHSHEAQKILRAMKRESPGTQFENRTFLQCEQVEYVQLKTGSIFGRPLTHGFGPTLPVLLPKIPKGLSPSDYREAAQKIIVELIFQSEVRKWRDMLEVSTMDNIEFPVGVCTARQVGTSRKRHDRVLISFCLTSVNTQDHLGVP